MEIQKVGKRGLLFSFYELENSKYGCQTNVYVINEEEHFFICDTYLGPDYMKTIKNHLESKYGKKTYIVFNSHGHWDHIWGNSEFENNIIISHTECRNYIEKFGREELTNHFKEFARKDITIQSPNITFTDQITFEDEGIAFFYSPGHSVDSASCYDFIDNTLFVGDNVDDPIPTYMSWDKLSKYKQTLEHYIKINADNIVQSHGKVANNRIIKKNLDYIKKLINNSDINFNDKKVNKNHNINLESLGLNS